MHILVDFAVKTTSGFSDFCVHIVLHVVQRSTGLLCFFLLITKLFKCLLDDVSFFVLLLFVFRGDFDHLEKLCFSFEAFLATLGPRVRLFFQG